MDLVSTKYTYACDPDYCDCLIELTTSDKFGFPSSVTNITCPCGRVLEPLSVVPDIINPINQPVQKEEIMETTELSTPYIPSMLVTYKKIAGTYASPEAPEYVTEKVTDIEWSLHNGRLVNDKMQEMNNKVVKLDNMLSSYCQDNDNADMEFIAEIANLFDIRLTKDISFTGTISFSGTITVDLTEEFDLEDLIRDTVSVDAFSGDCEISDYQVDDVREDY
jgi:hypothetical protein